MKNTILFTLFIFIPGFLFGQIRNLEEENSSILALSELVSQACQEQFAPSYWNKPGRQNLRLDAETMNLVYSRTPYDSADNNLPETEIEWYVRVLIPVHEIDSIIGDYEKQTITIKIKQQRASIQNTYLIPGGEYAPASQESQLTIYSGNIMKIRNLTERLQNQVGDLQQFHSKKMVLVNYLNRQLEENIKSAGITMVQPFQIDNRNQLSLVVQKGDSLEKQVVSLSGIRGIQKEGTSFLLTLPAKTERTISSKENRFPVSQQFSDTFTLYFPASENDLTDHFEQIGIPIK